MSFSQKAKMLSMCLKGYKVTNSQKQPVELLVQLFPKFQGISLDSSKVFVGL